MHPVLADKEEPEAGKHHWKGVKNVDHSESTRFEWLTSAFGKPYI